jgi:hypothetical protein
MDAIKGFISKKSPTIFQYITKIIGVNLMTGRRAADNKVLAKLVLASNCKY